MTRPLAAKTRAMTSSTAVVLVCVLVAATALLTALVRAVRDDGLGHRPPPAARPGAQAARDHVW